MFEDRATTLKTLHKQFYRKKILVVGDLMLDRHLWGEVNRISPEAPVPVVRLQRETQNCGGAANVALNLAALGIKPILAGFVGQDADGDTLLKRLQQAGVDTQCIVALAKWPTITKNRIIGGHQQMLRFDREDPPPPGSSAAHQELLENVDTAIKNGLDAILLSDYAKGVLSTSLCRSILSETRRQGIPALVDPKGMNYEKYAHATCITPNRHEITTALRLPNQELDTILTASQKMVAELGLDFMAVTLSELGIALIDPQSIKRLPAMAKEVFDVSGAGDTVIATLSAGLAAGLSRVDALHLANLAAGVVVGKVGTTPITLQELTAACSSEEAIEQSEKIVSLEKALDRVNFWRMKGERIVFTNGCFDLLHAGHVTYLERAKKLGSRLIIGLNTDRSVRNLKGESRPVIHEGDRARVMAALAAVDLVILFDEPTPLRLIQTLRPDILAKGADYSEDQVVGGKEVKAWGGEVLLVPLMDGKSTSRILSAIRGERESLLS